MSWPLSCMLLQITKPGITLEVDLDYLAFPALNTIVYLSDSHGLDYLTLQTLRACLVFSKHFWIAATFEACKDHICIPYIYIPPVEGSLILPIYFDLQQQTQDSQEWSLCVINQEHHYCLSSSEQADDLNAWKMSIMTSSEQILRNSWLVYR